MSVSWLGSLVLLLVVLVVLSYYGIFYFSHLNRRCNEELLDIDIKPLEQRLGERLPGSEVLAHMLSSRCVYQLGYQRRHARVGDLKQERRRGRVREGEYEADPDRCHP